MYSHRPHPLLEQVPLTVSPFISLPTATTLSYTYKTMPSSIPPSALGIPTASSSGEADNPGGSGGGGPSGQPQPRFVVAQSGAAAHPDEIVASCRDLHAHVARLQEDAERDLRKFEESVRQRDLEEKRRVAPGWLDSDARLLQPEKSAPAAPAAGGEPMIVDQTTTTTTTATAYGGAALDRAFGGMNLK